MNPLICLNPKQRHSLHFSILVTNRSEVTVAVPHNKCMLSDAATPTADEERYVARDGIEIV